MTKILKITKFIPNEVAQTTVNPVVASSEIPEWYRKGEAYYFSDGHKSKGMKTCIPILDALSTGYLVKTSVNIYITKNHNNSLSINYDEEFNAEMEPVEIRSPDLGKTIPRPAGHLDVHLSWKALWGWETPKGYSSLVVHPLNRFDLPFTTVSGIIDSDKYISAGNISFFLREDFEGIIPKGTPMFQVIPIKRKEWNAIICPELIEKAGKRELKGINGGYKKKMWTKKSYSIKEKNE